MHEREQSIRRRRLTPKSSRRLLAVFSFALAAGLLGYLVAAYIKAGGNHTLIEIHLVTREFRLTKKIGGIQVSSTIQGSGPFRVHFPDFPAEEGLWRTAGASFGMFFGDETRANYGWGGYMSTWLGVYMYFEDRPEQLLIALESLAKRANKYSSDRVEYRDGVAWLVAGDPASPHPTIPLESLAER